MFLGKCPVPHHGDTCVSPNSSGQLKYTNTKISRTPCKEDMNPLSLYTNAEIVFRGRLDESHCRLHRNMFKLSFCDSVTLLNHDTLQV